MTKQLKLLAFLFTFAILIAGCKKDDDDDSSGGGGSQSQYFTVTKSGTEYQNGNETVFYQSGSVEFNTVYSDSPYTSAGLEFLNIPDEGQYSASKERGFAFGVGTDFWFSTSATTITIETHNHSTNFVKGTVSGSMESLGGTNSTNSISAEFAFFY